MKEISREAAVEYWGKRLGGEVFLDESEARQNQALISAIDSLAPYVLNLPTTDKEAATLEQAMWLLSSRAELQSHGVTSFSLGGISESYDIKGRPVSVAPAAWRIIKKGVDGQRGGGKVWLY